MSSLRTLRLIIILITGVASSTDARVSPKRSAPTRVGGATVKSLPSDAEIRHMLVTRVDVQKRAVGIVVGVTGRFGHHIVSYGVTSLTGRTPVDGRTVYDIGSLTKIFTALLLADDVEHGRLKLDQPIRDCVPVSSGFLGPDGREVTFADLATHTSGLPLAPDNLPSKDPKDKYAGYTDKNLLAFLSTFKASRSPGAGYEYSNVGYGLLGLALFRCDHEDFSTLVRERITAPLGMGNTSLEPTADMQKREAIGYDMDFHVLPHWKMGALAAAGGLRSTADDLLKLLDAALGLKRSPLAPAFSMMTSFTRPGGMEPATAIGLGWNVYRDGNRQVFWKNGSVGGYRTFMGYETSSRTGVVALANMQTAEGADDVGLHLLDPSYAVDLKTPRPHHIIAIDPAILDRYVGTYRFSETDIVTIKREGDDLVAIAQGTGPLAIAAEGNDRFYLKLVDAELTFRSLINGHETELVWSQGGVDEIGKRID